MAGALLNIRAAVASALALKRSENDQGPLSIDLEGNLRVVARTVPMRGRYRIGVATGKYAGIAANGELFQMRWTATDFLALIWQVSVSVSADVAATAAGQIDRQLIVARKWTANGTGGTSISLTGDVQKLRTDFPSSLVTDMRIASNAALGVGTKTLDGVGIGIASATLGTEALGALPTIIPKVDLFNANQGPNAYPTVLGPWSGGEGIVVRMLTAQPASSSLMTYVDVDWSEVPLAGF